MGKRILILFGHPDPGGEHFGNALLDAYTQEALQAGHEVRCIRIAELDFPWLRSREQWESADLPESIAQAQRDIEWAEHLLIEYPLWLGTMPALLKAFFEQVLRPGFAISGSMGGEAFRRLLTGRSARVVVTMGMPAFIYRVYFRAHGVKNLSRNILGFCGFSPVHTSIVGLVEGRASARERWLTRMRTYGAQAR